MAKILRFVLDIKNATINVLALLLKRLQQLNKRKTSIASKPNVKTSLKIIFINKKTLVFLFSYVILVLLLGKIYFNQLYKAAKTERVFDISFDITKSPNDIFFDNILCDSSSTQIPGTCELGRVVWLLFPLIAEISCVVFILSFRKTVRKRMLGLFFVTFQIAVVGMYISYVLIADNVVSRLKAEAYKSIDDSVAIMNNKYELGEKVSNIDCASCIASEIKNNPRLPLLIENNPVEWAVLALQDISLSSKETYYNAIIIPYVLLNKGENTEIDQELTQIPFNVLLFPKTPVSILIIGNVNKDIVQELSPVIAEKLLVQDYPTYIKSEKTIYYKVMNENEYIAYQTKKEEERKNEIKSLIEESNKNIQELNNLITHNQEIIDNYESSREKNQSLYDYYVTDSQKDYDKLCKSYKDFYACVSWKDNIEYYKKTLSDAMKTNEINRDNAVTYNKSAVASKNYLLGEVSSLRESLALMEKDPVTAAYQNAVSYSSESANSVVINYYDKETYPLSDYLYTTLHEFLHVYSYKLETELPVFLNEGLTEYQAAKVLNEYTGYGEEKITYVEEAGIVKLLLNKISQDELTNLYFDQSETELKNLFSKYYNASQYDDFVSKGNYTYYANINDEKARADKYTEIENMLTSE